MTNEVRRDRVWSLVEMKVMRQQFKCTSCDTPVEVYATEDGAHVYDGNDIKHMCPNSQCQHTFWLPEVMPKIIYVEK